MPESWNKALRSAIERRPPQTASDRRRRDYAKEHVEADRVLPCTSVRLRCLTRLSVPPPQPPQGLLRGHSGLDYLPPSDTHDSHFCLTCCLSVSPECSSTEGGKCHRSY